MTAIFIPFSRLTKIWSLIRLILRFYFEWYLERQIQLVKGFDNNPLYVVKNLGGGLWQSRMFQMFSLYYFLLYFQHPVFF